MYEIDKISPVDFKCHCTGYVISYRYKFQHEEDTGFDANFILICGEVKAVSLIFAPLNPFIYSNRPVGMSRGHFMLGDLAALTVKIVLPSEVTTVPLQMFNTVPGNHSGTICTAEA
jgi:hypothetical protein